MTKLRIRNAREGNEAIVSAERRGYYVYAVAPEVHPAMRVRVVRFRRHRGILQGRVLGSSGPVWADVGAAYEN